MSTDTPITDQIFDHGNRKSLLDHARNLERTLATKELEVAKLREAARRYYVNSDALSDAVNNEMAKALSTPITTEALDSYVAEKVKEAQEAVIQRVDVSIKGYMNAIDHFEATIKAFREHYLRAIECNEETHQDKPHCACSLVDLGWHESVDSAVGAWHVHVLEITNLPPLPAQPTEQPK